MIKTNKKMLTNSNRLLKVPLKIWEDLKHLDDANVTTYANEFALFIK